MNDVVHVIALNRALDVTHTHLTRAQGAAPDLPPLAEWLGVGAVDADRIEVFPVADLQPLGLSHYLAAAFDAEEGAVAAVRARLDAIDGHVLLLPGDAISGDLDCKAEASLIATLPLIQPDHGGDLPKAETGPVEMTPPARTPDTRSGRAGSIVVAGLALTLLVALGLWWLG